MAPGNEGLQRGLITDCHYLNPSIGGVPDPSFEPQLDGLLGCVGSEKNSLYASRDYYMYLSHTPIVYFQFP